MAWLRTLLLLIGALSALTLGTATPSVAEPEPAHCHQGQSNGSDPDRPKAMAGMVCCIACVAAPSIRETTKIRSFTVSTTLMPTPARLPLGLHLAPEPGPPRLLA